MTFIFVAFAVVLVVWAAVLWTAMKAGDREKERAREETRAAVRQTIGLEIEGDPIGRCSMRGVVHGVALEIEVGGTRALPGPSDESRSATSVAGPTRLPEQIVCRVEDVDHVMGALPAVPRRTIGEPSFDARYAVFVGVAAGAPRDAGYREAAADAPALAWVETKTLGDMVSQGLIFMRVKDGRAELAFDPRSAGGVAPLVTTTVNVLRRAAGHSLVSASTPRTFVTPAVSYDPVSSVLVGALASGFIAPFGATLAFLPPLRELDAEAACGKGGEIRVSSSSDGDGTSYGLYCSNDRDASLAVHYACAIALFFTIFLGSATLLGLTRWPSKRPAS
jgi:hypothetical protein